MKLAMFLLVTLVATICLPMYRKLNPERFLEYLIWVAFMELLAWLCFICN